MATRAERKAKQRAIWEEQKRIKDLSVSRRQQFEREHPILSGAVKVVDYQEPKWNYTPNPV